LSLRRPGLSRTRATEELGGPGLRGPEAPGAGRPSKVPDNYMRMPRNGSLQGTPKRVQLNKAALLKVMVLTGILFRWTSSPSLPDTTKNGLP
jgi:hypothetical protein